MFDIADFPRIQALEYGGGPEVIVALHGWLDNAASFCHLAPFLEQNYRLIALDLPGHGLSDHFTSSDAYLLTHQLRWLRAVLEVISTRPVILLGHSMGAAIAQLYSACFPERVSKLISLDMLGSVSEDTKLFVKRLRKSTFEWKQSIERSREPSQSMTTLYSSIDLMIERRSRLNNVPPKSISEMVHRGAKQLGDGFTWSFDPKLLLTSPTYLSESQNRAMLSTIKTKSLFILAKQGVIVSTLSYQSRLASIPRSQVVELPWGHHQHLSHADEVAYEITNWLMSFD